MTLTYLLPAVLVASASAATCNNQCIGDPAICGQTFGFEAFGRGRTYSDGVSVCTGNMADLGMDDMATINSEEQLAAVTAWLAGEKTPNGHDSTNSAMYIKSAQYAGFPAKGPPFVEGCVAIDFSTNSFKYIDCNNRLNFLCGSAQIPDDLFVGAECVAAPNPTPAPVTPAPVTPAPAPTPSATPEDGEDGGSGSGGGGPAPAPAPTPGIIVTTYQGSASGVQGADEEYPGMANPQTSVKVADTTGINVGDGFKIDQLAMSDSSVVTGVADGVVTLANALTGSYFVGATITITPAETTKVDSASADLVSGVIAATFAVAFALL